MEKIKTWYAQVSLVYSSHSTLVIVYNLLLTLLFLLLSHENLKFSYLMNTLSPLFLIPQSSKEKLDFGQYYGIMDKALLH